MEMSDGSARFLAGLLETRTGQQLQVGRRWRLEMALTPIMRQRGVPTADMLVSMIAVGGDRALADQVIDALLNNETSFFRDRASFDLLTKRGLERLGRVRADRRALRVWCAGCSTGQEAYSVAMLLAGQPEWSDWRIEIIATDVSEGAIATARAGRYSQFEIQRGLPVRDMMRWFEKDGDEHWQATPALRRLVRFNVHSLLDPSPSAVPFDAILCRNVLLYFSTSVRRLVFGRLAAAVAPEGLLMLGAGETVLGHSEEFVSDYEARGLYRPIVGVDGGATTRAA